MRKSANTYGNFHIANCALTLLWAITLILPAAFGQANNSHQTTWGEFKRPVYVPFDRSEEDWSFLRDPELRTDLWDPIKYIALRNTPGWYLTLAGEERSFYELYRNYHWGAGPQDGNGYYLNRFLGSADFHLGSSTRVLLELKSGLEFGRTGGPRPVQDEDKLDVNQLFVEFRLPPSQGERPPADLKIGRQDLEYGDGTLLDVLDLNVRRSFDGIKLILRPKDWQVDLFAMRPALSKPGLFDDYPDHTQTLWGVYGVTSKHLPRFVRQLDTYYLGLDRKFARFAQGSGSDQRHTIGSLIHGGKGNFSYLAEVDLQFGRFGSGNILAWKYAQELSYSFSHRKFRPVPSFLFGISSGDKNPANPNLQTFYPLFPKGLYYGFIDDSGSLNAVVLHEKLALQISKNVLLAPDNFFFWRQRTTDGLYSQPGVLLRSGLASQKKFVGALQDIAITWTVDHHTTVQLLGTYYEAGAFLRETIPPGKNTAYISGKVIYRF
ncbi:MAG TPA: alginate export family protein [Candidatus Acidoferrum sp.]|jgi:hypothetical protein